ncbi:hypothetical protein HDU67_002980 [Dinochytrium kinnereticum]|nr:hypothetical protein HDU67_002980 [Dinochytrium kinnereticum]
MSSEVILRSRLSRGFSARYPSHLEGTAMTREAFEERIQFISETAGKSLLPGYVKYIPLTLWVMGLISTIVMNFAIPSRCESVDSTCKGITVGQIFASIGLMIGSFFAIVIGGIIMQCGMIKTSDVLDTALSHLNNVDRVFGFAWDYDVLISTRTSTTRHSNGHTSTSNYKIYTYYVTLRQTSSNIIVIAPFGLDPTAKLQHYPPSFTDQQKAAYPANVQQPA